MRNLPKIYLRSLKNVAPGLHDSSLRGSRALLRRMLLKGGYIKAS